MHDTAAIRTKKQRIRSATSPPYSRADYSASRRQAALEANDDVGNDYDLEEGDEYYQTRLPTSARRYQVSPEEVYQSGNTRYHVRYVDVPKRKSRQAQLPPAQQDRYTEEVETIPKAKRHIHPLLYLGVGMLAMAALFLLLSSAGAWIQTTKDELTYGRPRTFNIDAVVGHNDSAANPTHFIAINLNRHVEVIEQPGGDASKMKVYQITTLFGDGEDLTPVTLTFRDLTGNGKLDMLIHIHDTTISLYQRQRHIPTSKTRRSQRAVVGERGSMSNYADEIRAVLAQMDNGEQTTATTAAGNARCVCADCQGAGRRSNASC